MKARYLGDDARAEFDKDVEDDKGTFEITLQVSPNHPDIVRGGTSEDRMQYFVGKGGIVTPDGRAT